MVEWTQEFNALKRLIISNGFNPNDPSITMDLIAVMFEEKMFEEEERRKSDLLNVKRMVKSGLFKKVDEVQ